MMNDKQWNEAIRGFANSQKDALRKISNSVKKLGITSEEAAERMKDYVAAMPKAEDLDDYRNQSED